MKSLKRRPLLVVLAAALCLIAPAPAPAPASAAVDIVSHGFSPDPAVIGGKTTLDVEVRVGAAPYIVEFFCCTIFQTDTATTVIDDRSPTTQGLTGRHTFSLDVADANSDQRSVTVRVTDSNGDQSRQVFTYQRPTAPVPPPTPDPEPRSLPQCGPVVSFGLIRAQTTSAGCWQQRRAPAAGYSDAGVSVAGSGIFYEFNGSFQLNGIPFPAAPAGKTYILAEPSAAAPGGQLGLDGTVEVRLKQVTVFRQKLLWKLPTGDTEGRLAAFSLPDGLLGGLPISGDVKVLFRKRAGHFATSFPITVTLPSIFKPSPGTTGSITGGTEITTDDTGAVNLDGGKIQVANAAIGKLAIKDLCFSYLSANVSTAFAACEPPPLNGAPAVSCFPPPVSQERFDGALLIGLPTKSETELAGYGGISGGKFSYAGGFVDNAGIPLIEGITLERVGFGLCLNPLVIKGDAGLGFAGGLVRGDVSLTYGEPAAKSFFIEAFGAARIGDIPVGDATVRLDSTGTVSFGLNTSVFILGGAIQFNGGVKGFVQSKPFAFNADGKISACLNAVIFTRCADAAAVTVSNLGIGGCLGTGKVAVSGMFFWKPRGGNLPQSDFGFGCGFQALVRVARTRQAGAPFTFPVPADGDRYVAHIYGAPGAAPKVKITSPSGKVITSGSGTLTSDEEGTFVMIESAQDGETAVFLQKDAAEGDWVVEALPGSTVTGVAFQGEEPEPTVVSATVDRDDEERVADVSYDARAGDTIRLDVIGKDYQQSLAAKLAGKACPAGRKAPGRTTAQSRCARVRWTPTFGFGGTRSVQATVLDKSGAIIDKKTVARFDAAPPEKAPVVPELRMVRRGSSVFAIWGASGGTTARYGAYAILGDGRRIGHTSPEGCLAWKIKNVASDTAVTLRLQAGRQDLRFGGSNTVRLAGGAAYAGPKKLRGESIPTPCASL
jgi:hypothetical protein